MRHKLRTLIRQNLTVADAAAVLADGDNLFQQGWVNSLFAMKLLAFVETEFAITVAEEDMELVNFSTIDNIVALIQRKRGP